jgi:hypothetical protein
MAPREALASAKVSRAAGRGSHRSVHLFSQVMASRRQLGRSELARRDSLPYGFGLLGLFAAQLPWASLVPWKNRTQRPPDPAFRCRCPSHLVQISFRSRILGRTRSHRTYNHHPIRRYRRTPGRLNFLLRIRLSAVSNGTLARLRQASALVSTELRRPRRPRAARPAGAVVHVTA